MTKDLTDVLDEPEIFRHNGKLLLLYKDNNSNTPYTVRDGAGRILGSGELPVEFCHDDALLMFDLGPGKDISPKGKIIDVQRPLLYFLAKTKGKKILL